MELSDADLARYFDLFDSTLTLAKRLNDEKQQPQEVLILLCARLDALASRSVPERTSNKKAFSKFLISYAARRSLFEGISVGDVYYEVGYHRWLIEGTIPKPGRLQKFSRIDDPILYLLAESGIPLTVKDANRLLTRMMDALKSKYRAIPGQPKTKRAIVGFGEGENTVVEALAGPRLSKFAPSLRKSLKPLLESKRVATTLYERYRSESIHGAGVDLDTKNFFGATEPYWIRRSSEFFGPYQLIEFPCAFLIETLRKCIRTYRTHLVTKGKLPPDVHFQTFRDRGLDYLKFLDHELLPQPASLKFKRETGFQRITPRMICKDYARPARSQHDRASAQHGHPAWQAGDQPAFRLANQVRVLQMAG